MTGGAGGVSLTTVVVIAAGCHVAAFRCRSLSIR
jgi:hypothetical protein